MTISSCVKKLDFEVNVTRAPESHCDPGALSFDNSEKHVDEVKFIPIKWDHHKRSEAGGHQQLNRKRLFRHSPQLLAPPPMKLIVPRRDARLFALRVFLRRKS